MWRTLIMQPAVLAALSSMVLGGPKQPAAPTWLHRAGVALGVLAVFAGLASGWMWLAKNYPIEQATFFFCLATALVSAVCLGFAHGVSAYKKWRAYKWQKKMMEKVENTADFALNELETFGREYPLTATALSVLAGYLAADRAAAGTEKLLAALDLTTSNLKGNEDNE